MCSKPQEEKAPISSEVEESTEAVESTELIDSAKAKVDAVWSVYLIRTAANQLYCGVTTDVARRFSEHQSKPQGAKYLKGKGPLTLAWSQAVGDKRYAMQLEYRIKQLAKKHKEQLIIGKRCVHDVMAEQVAKKKRSEKKKSSEKKKPAVKSVSGLPTYL
ncbi:hypothetical protein C9I90_03040 [Photobacterium aphoticum]|nr:hypothetical protein C9I90_03040 [Photobacterium aphoticum]